MSSNRSTPLATDLDRRIVDEIPRVRAFLRRLCSEEAEDLVQEVAARALRSRDSFRDEGTLRGWLLRTAFRAYLDHRERERRSPIRLGEHDTELEDEKRPSSPSPELREEVAKLLDRLPAIEKEILERFHREGQSVREIARAISMPEGTVKSHLHRARRRLARREG